MSGMADAVQEMGRHVDHLSEDPLKAYNKAITAHRAPNLGEGPSVLSAPVYPYASASSSSTSLSGKRRTGGLGYGSLVSGEVEDTDAHDALETSSEAKAPPKKRTRQPEGEEDDITKKTRGRPRLDTQDKTAADRRRTQIRLAQRAYRHRKETTISGLKRRVGELESIIEQMNRSFLDFHDNLIGSGVLASEPGIALQLRNTVDQLGALVQTGADDVDDREEVAHVADTGQASAASISPSPLICGDLQHDGEKQFMGFNTSQFGYEMVGNAGTVRSNVGDVAAMNYSGLISSKAAPTGGRSIFDQWSSAGEYQQSKMATSANHVLPSQPLDPPIERPLKASTPYSYSFQETTFARRLHRLCLEHAFWAVTNPNTDPAHVARIFRLTLTYSNKKGIIARFQSVLNRKAGERLEALENPFFRIGGAGTHFPRQDERGNPIYPPNSFSAARAFGPLPQGETNIAKEIQSPDQLLESLGLDGVWFDTHDVEEYLKTKGIYLTGQSSFVEVDPTMLAQNPPRPPSGSDSSSIPTMSGSQMPDMPTPSSHSLGGDFSLFGQGLPGPSCPQHGLLMPNRKRFDSETVGSTDQGWAVGVPPSRGPTPALSEVAQRNRRPLTLDVNTMLARLAEKGTCLGRAPGFRREEVDRMLLMALQETF